MTPTGAVDGRERRPCRHEPEVVRAESRGAWSDELRAHLRACDRCRSATETAAWLRARAATGLTPPATLPDASALLWRARLRRRHLDRGREVDGVRRTLDGTRAAVLATLILALLVVLSRLALQLGDAVEAGRLDLVALALALGGGFLVAAGVAAFTVRTRVRRGA